jgi:SAM-dependent methyltransferase
MAWEALDLNAAQRRYWNTVARPRWVATRFRERRNQESLALLLAHLGIAGGESVPLATAVGEHGRVVAVDISESMLGAARQRVGESGLRNTTLLHGDAQMFELEPAGFDLATSRRRHVLRRSDGGLTQHRRRAEAGRAPRLRLLGIACGHWLIS